jgi:hypothetical protein
MKFKPFLVPLAATWMLTACEGGEVPDLQTIGDEVVDMKKRESLFGRGGLDVSGNSKTVPRTGGTGTGIGVNAYLWRATLDTLSIWPISSADPFGGIIITDWYAPPETPNEQFKLNVFILDQALRADGVRVSVFRQIRDQRGGWQQASVQPATTTQLENAILMRARQFRSETLQQ